MKSLFKLCVLVINLTWVVGASSQQLQSTAIKRPLAMDRLQNPPSELFALTPYEVFALHDDGHSLAVVGSFGLSTALSPSDISVAEIRQQIFVIISGRNQLSGGFLNLYSSSGTPMKSWSSRHPLCGVDYDGQNTIYAASCDTNEIYQANLQGRDQVTFVAEVVGARHLGPLAIDGSRGRLLIGEIDSGEIFSLEINSHNSHLFASGFGTPQAFTFSPNRKKLLIADSSRRKVYELDLTKTSPTPIAFGASKQFKEPDGLALLTGGRFAVADDRADAIFILPSSLQAGAR